MISEAEAIAIVTIWLETPFDGGRHQRRIQQIPEIDALFRSSSLLSCGPSEVL